MNEQSILAMMHTIWMREHNRIEGLLHRMNPTWNGETLFQETRRIVGATVQHITFNEFLPIVLGPKLVETYRLNLTQSGYFTGQLCIHFDCSFVRCFVHSFIISSFLSLFRSFICLLFVYLFIQLINQICRQRAD